MSKADLGPIDAHPGSTVAVDPVAWISESGALESIITALGPLSKDAQFRMLYAAAVFFGVDGRHWR